MTVETAIHSIGFEPITFGSVDRWSYLLAKSVLPILPGKSAITRKPSVVATDGFRAFTLEIVGCR